MPLPYARAGGATREEAEALLTVDASGAAEPTPLPGRLRPVPFLDVPRDAPRRRVSFGVAPTGEYLINGRPFAASTSRAPADPRPRGCEVTTLTGRRRSLSSRRPR